MKIKKILREEFKGWKPIEVIWLVVACAIIIEVSISWGDTLMGIISAATGVICVILTGKGKLSAYLFGLINAVLYAIIAFQAHLYGETMLNLLYYVPMQFIGFHIWRKNMNQKNHSVNKYHMKNSKRLLWLLITIVGVAIYGFILQLMGDAMPYVDSLTTICSIIAMIVSVKMYAEQWWIWIAVDAFSIYMWWCNLQSGSDNIATLLMWVVYLLNAIFMCVKWEKEISMKKHKGAKYEV